MCELGAPISVGLPCVESGRLEDLPLMQESDSVIHRASRNVEGVAPATVGADVWGIATGSPTREELYYAVPGFVPIHRDGGFSSTSLTRYQMA